MNYLYRLITFLLPEFAAFLKEATPEYYQKPKVAAKMPMPSDLSQKSSDKDTIYYVGRNGFFLRKAEINEVINFKPKGEFWNEH